MNIEDAARITWDNGNVTPWAELTFDEEREWTECTKIRCGLRHIDLSDLELTEEKLLDRLYLPHNC